MSDLLQSSGKEVGDLKAMGTGVSRRRVKQQPNTVIRQNRNGFHRDRSSILVNASTLEAYTDFLPNFEPLRRDNIRVCEVYFPAGKRDREKDEETTNANTAAPRIMDSILDTECC